MVTVCLIQGKGAVAPVSPIGTALGVVFGRHGLGLSVYHVRCREAHPFFFGGSSFRTQIACSGVLEVESDYPCCSSANYPLRLPGFINIGFQLFASG
jgi:hypothetical protein